MFFNVIGIPRRPPIARLAYNKLLFVLIKFFLKTMNDSYSNKYQSTASVNITS